MDYAIDRIDLLKLDIQGIEHRALAGAVLFLGAGRIGTIFSELNWAEEPDETCPAAESIRILEDAGYWFARPARRLRWQQSGGWMRSLSDVVTGRVPSEPVS